ncbi:hypothetical protein D910_10102 [Dendroctonus ponderosae]|uniref:FAS1 domain-containing protein n=1 Tax=Dendroctonus ponderosae TaxID=77166 RepID=U4UFN2_DENPD|nr:hypothetical protein D910_10102 [Dendroctonus ponderosae]
MHFPEKLVLAKTTTVKPPTAVFDELTKDVVPPGTDFQLLKSDASGSLESIKAPSTIPDQKKVTFVLLEEQSDGSLKVQGVKGNGKEKPDVDLDSILKKIKAGEIRLPSTTLSPPTTVTTTARPTFATSPKTISVTVTPNSFATDEDASFAPTGTLLSTFSTSAEAETFPVLSTSAGGTFPSSSLPTSSAYTTARDIHTSSRSTTPNSIFENDFSQTTGKLSSQDQSKQASSISTSNQNSILSEPSPTIATEEQPKPTEYIVKSHSQPPSDPTHLPELTAVLKSNGKLGWHSRPGLKCPCLAGLYAMARFLKQSGLDTVLNDTGPYTVFAPTDKAFRTLLVQLGGPERAEEKFKENPRLLSGLLLHHVIPGAFSISSLQDEMTGVSLAGTQLRVNQYNMHDNEWNDVKVTTINGARVIEEQQDLPIPQGIAHSIDRVMFPLPVGDLVQTMQADRERRFTSFLRAVFASGFAEMLQGPKSITLFAPTDKAFAALSPEDLTKTVTDPALAKELVLRHLINGALYTNGMRYYQVKDSLQKDSQITISKHSGKARFVTDL